MTIVSRCPVIPALPRKGNPENLCANAKPRRG